MQVRQKPWKNPKDDFAKEFWKVARKTPYYEELLYDMCGQAKEKIHPGKAVVDVLRKAAKKNFCHREAGYGGQLETYIGN